MAEKIFNKGDIIFQQGELGSTFYQIEEGSVGIFAKDPDGHDSLKLTDLTKGQFVGEMAVIDTFPRSADAVCQEDGTKLIEISEAELNSFFEKDPDRITQLMKALSTRLRDLTRDYDKAKAIAEQVGAAGLDPDKEFLRSLRKYTYYYKTMPNEIPEPSAESVREKKAKKKHSEGFAKNVVSYPAGTVICREGDLVECMYDIHWGRVGIYNNYGTPDEVMLTTLAADNFFGEMGMVSGQPRSATAVAIDQDTTVEIIYPADFKELFEKNPSKIDMILRHLSSRLRVLTAQYLEVCGKIAEKAEEK